MIRGSSVKDIRNQLGEGEFVQRGHFSDKGRDVLQMRTSALLVPKTNFRIFRNLWCVHTDKGEGQFFAILCGRLE